MVAAETGITVSCDEGSSPICFDRVGCETSQSRKKAFLGVMVGWFPGCWRKKAAAKKAKYVACLCFFFARQAGKVGRYNNSGVVTILLFIVCRVARFGFWGSLWRRGQWLQACYPVAGKAKVRKYCKWLRVDRGAESESMRICHSNIRSVPFFVFLFSRRGAAMGTVSVLYLGSCMYVGAETTIGGELW